jgi:hypothetical protein
MCSTVPAPRMFSAARDERGLWDTLLGTSEVLAAGSGVAECSRGHLTWMRGRNGAELLSRIRGSGDITQGAAGAIWPAWLRLGRADAAYGLGAGSMLQLWFRHRATRSGGACLPGGFLWARFWHGEAVARLSSVGPLVLSSHGCTWRADDGSCILAQGNKHLVFLCSLFPITVCSARHGL